MRSQAVRITMDIVRFVFSTSKVFGWVGRSGKVSG